jgi:hypothetical protein
MKLQVVVQTPLGEVKAKVREVTQEEHDRLLEMLKSPDLAYLTFDNVEGNVVFLPENVIKNSVVELRIVD